MISHICEEKNIYAKVDDLKMGNVWLVCFPSDWIRMKSTRGSPEQAEGQIGTNISSGRRGGNAKMQILQNVPHSTLLQSFQITPSIFQEVE